MSLSELIRALEIFNRYGDPSSPTHCEHDTLMVMISPDDVTDEDKAKLETMGFHADTDEDHFYSFRYGSA